MRDAVPYLRQVSGILLLLFAVGLLLTWIRDPLGILGTRRALPQLCADGIKTGQDRLAIPALAMRTKAEFIVTGTSRVKRGIVREHWREYVGAASVNLAMSGQTMDEAHRMIAPLLRRPGLRELWIGLDFGMFYGPAPVARVAPIGESSNSTSWAVYRAGLFHLPAIREALLSIASVRSCRAPLRGVDGFLDGLTTEQLDTHAWDVIGPMGRGTARYVGSGPRVLPLYRERLDLLVDLVRQAAKYHVRVKLFINPSAPGYAAALEVAGVSEVMTRWRADIARIAAAAATDGQLQFVDFSVLPPPVQEGEPVCRSAAQESCDFFDLTHYRPHIGRRIIARLAGTTEAVQ